MEEKPVANHPYLHLLMLCAGILVQAVFPESVIAFLVGYGLIAASPINLYTNFVARIYEDPGDKTKPCKWLPFPEDKLDELLCLVKPRSNVSSGGASKSGAMWGILGAGLVITIAIIIHGGEKIVMTGTMINYNYTLFCTAPMLIAVLICFYSPRVLPHPLAIQVKALTIFRRMPLPAAFMKRFEARLVKDVNGEPDILEARLQIRPNEPIDPLICMMATISRTEVKSCIYPYAYYVLVFKTRKIFEVSTQFAAELSQLIKRSHFKMENSYKDNESVIVILPKKNSQYTTDATDCKELASLMYQTCELLSRYRNEIIRVCR